MRETPAQTFHRGGPENVRFWARFRTAPALPGARVLDVGCSYGRLCVDIAAAGAREVVGVDIDAEAIAFARENVARNYPDLAPKIDFRCGNLASLDLAPFDIIVSKESAEHFLDFEGMLRAMAARLKPGGLLFMGFGPLWRSPFGDHGMFKLKLPWAHLLVPERLMMPRVSRWWGREIRSIEQMGLNRMPLAGYVRAIRASGLQTVEFGVNRGDRLAVKLCSAIRCLPLLKEYFTLNIYCVLKR